MSSQDIGLLIAACLFVGGLATILQTIGVRFFGSQLPLVQGVSFAGVSTMVAIVHGGGGIQAVFGWVIAASLIGLLITPLFSKIIRFFPPVVTGTVITTIGLTLMPVAANWAMGGNKAAPNYGSMANIGLAAATMAIVLLLSKVGNAAISRLSILLAMVLGTLIAFLFGMADFSKVGQGEIVAFPTPFAFGPPTFEIAAIISMLIVILVTLTETSADIIAVGEIVGTKVDSKRSADGLILVILGLLPILGRVVAAVPTPVLGGAGVVLFGTVAASGIRTLSKVEYKNNMNLIIVAASIGFGMIPIAAPSFYDQFPSWFGTIFHSGISSAAVMAILLNLLFNHLKAGNSENQSVFVAGTERVVKEEDLQCLADGDRFEGGKLIDCDGKEVPVQSSEKASEH